MHVWLKVLFIYFPILCDNLFCISSNFRYSGRIGLVKVSRQEVGAETVTIKTISWKNKSDNNWLENMWNVTNKSMLDLRHLYPWTNVEKSMLSMEPERQSGRRTEQRQRIFGKKIFCSVLFFVYLYRLSSLYPGICTDIVGVKPIQLLVYLLSKCKQVFYFM